MQKVIFLVDMNAFFISCEMTRNQSLVGKPAAVAGDPSKRTGIILAANYEARKYGVKTAMVLHEALKLCPEMQLVPPDHSFYQQKSSEVMELLSNFTPLVEENSIDEAWLDMTGTEGLFGNPKVSAELIMNSIKDKLGLWCSIGIAENKFLAKMASDMKKPLGITELWREDIPHKLWLLPVRAMYGIGAKTAVKLNSIGIQTIGDLACFDRDYLFKTFGKVGLEYFELANGVDNSSVTKVSIDDIKSIGRSTTLTADTLDLNTLSLVLMELAEDIGMTARKNNKKGRTLQLTLKYSDFEVITRQTTINATYFTKDIYMASVKLLEKNLRGPKAVRLIGISLSGFEENPDMEQLSLFEAELLDKKSEQIDNVMDIIRYKYGTQKIGRAALLKRT